MLVFDSLFFLSLHQRNIHIYMDRMKNANSDTTVSEDSDFTIDWTMNVFSKINNFIPAFMIFFHWFINVPTQIYIHIWCVCACKYESRSFVVVTHVASVGEVKEGPPDGGWEVAVKFGGHDRHGESAHKGQREEQHQ